MPTHRRQPPRRYVRCKHGTTIHAAVFTDWGAAATFTMTAIHYRRVVVRVTGRNGAELTETFDLTAVADALHALPCPTEVRNAGP